MITEAEGLSCCSRSGDCVGV